jgi:CubicO group peptidase (beta-lactamase class C family)
MKSLFIAGVMGIVAGCSPAIRGEAATSRDKDAKPPPLIDAAIKATVEGRATGVVLIAKGGTVLWAGGIGNPTKGIPEPPRDAVFDALSIGKTFTAAALQTLAKEGRVDLSASLRRYIPELPAAFDQVTVQNALDNASGWGSYLNDKGDFDEETEAQLLTDLATADRPKTPGQYGYSNTGFQALGLVVQRASGRSFKEAMQTLVFRPAGMRSTDFLGAPSLAKRSVYGYVDGKPTGSPKDWPSTWSLLGAAGVATTVDDLFRFNRYFINGNGLGSRRQAMLADGVTTKNASPYHEAGRTQITYGSGFYHWRDASGRHVHFHGGDADFGFHAVMYWREEGDVFVMGLFNSGSPSTTFDRAKFIHATVGAADMLAP